MYAIFFYQKCAICGWFWGHTFQKKYSLILIFEVYIATYTPESNRKMQMNKEKELSNRTIKQNNEEIFARGENF